MNVAIVGIGIHPFGRHPGVSGMAQGAYAARQALADAGIGWADVECAFGGGVIIGYKFAPWANNIVVSPFASFDFMNAPVNHTFAGGSFLGTTANFMGTAGVKIGPQFDTGLWFYGIAGMASAGVITQFVRRPW